MRLEHVQCLASLLTGLLHAAGQLALAYVTAKTHGLEEEAARVAEAIGEGHLPQVEGMLSVVMCIACRSFHHVPCSLLIRCSESAPCSHWLLTGLTLC